MLWLCFALSGCAALALEALWMRSASLVLGQTAAATATVLACYFAGLGLGSAAARRLRARSVQRYAVLEFGVAAGAGWSLLVFRLLARDDMQAWFGPLAGLGAVAGTAVAILPATLCLGATLPALGLALVDMQRVGRRGGLLYAVNTLGGAIGLAAAGFGLPAWIGVTASYGVAAAGSLLAGVLALTVGTSGQRVASSPLPGASSVSADHPSPSFEPATRTPTRPVDESISVTRLRAVAAGAGALGLGLEVLWTRLFAQVLHNSVYSFSAVALVFLLAFAAGAAVAGLLLRRLAPAALAAAALVAAAAATAGGVWTFVHSTDGLAYVGMRSGLAEYLWRIIRLAAISAAPAAFASGMVLPALWAGWGRTDAVARPLGDLAAANTFGGIAGTVAAGFLGIPLLGIRATVLAVAIAYVVLADVIALPRGRLRPLAYAVLLGVVIINPMGAPLLHLRPDGEMVRTILEGASGIVSVVETDGDRQLRLDNYYVLGGSAAATNERRLGLVPLLLHPQPQRAAFIGLATGITASAGPALELPETTVVELVPEVAGAARDHFALWNGGLLERPDVHLVLDDGRRYLAASRQRFDVIVSDLFIPWHAGAGSLYSREMYATAAARLAPNGIFCQWLPLYQLTREEFELITHSFLSVFPQTSLWRADFYPDRPVIGLVGQLGSRRVDLDQVGQRLHRMPEWSRDPLLATARGLGMLYVGDLAGVADVFQAAPINTDDRPLLEFMAPQLTRINAAGDKDWFTAEALATFYDDIDRRLGGAADPLFGDDPEIRSARRAGTALYHYALAATRHDDSTAQQLEGRVRALVPEVVAGADAVASTAGASNAVASLADARMAFAALRTAQENLRRQLEVMERRVQQLAHAEQDR